MQSLLARHEGIFVEPASAVAVAAIIRDCRLGRLTEAARPIAVLTGTGLKDLRRFAAGHDVHDTLYVLDELRSLLGRIPHPPR